VPLDVVALGGVCAPYVSGATVQALVSVESAGNPYAIGVVDGVLQHQPRDRAEAVATVRALQAGGWNFSAGLGQINVRNWARLGLDAQVVFDPCANLRAMQRLLRECYSAAPAEGQARLQAALSCYYSGNFSTGFREGYVARVVAAAARWQEAR
jgi:type IV secretion system protein VirB1